MPSTSRKSSVLMLPAIGGNGDDTTAATQPEAGAVTHKCGQSLSIDRSKKCFDPVIGRLTQAGNPAL